MLVTHLPRGVMGPVGHMVAVADGLEGGPVDVVNEPRGDRDVDFNPGGAVGAPLGASLCLEEDARGLQCDYGAVGGRMSCCIMRFRRRPWCCHGPPAAAIRLQGLVGCS